MKSDNWAHIDIAGVMESHGEVPFLDKGMSGELTRRSYLPFPVLKAMVPPLSHCCMSDWHLNVITFL